MLSLSIAGGIFLLDHKIKEHVDSTRLQGSREGSTWRQSDPSKLSQQEHGVWKNKA